MNTVKFELGVILIVGLLLLLAQGQLTESLAVQFFLLLGYGVGAMVWIVLRTRRMMAKILGSGKQDWDGTQ